MSNSLAFVPPTFLNITAISAQNGLSILQCWQILPGFTTSSQAGTTGASILQLGNLANMSYSVLPPKFNAGLHNAPTPQWVAFLSGLAHITLPNSTVDACVRGGKDGFIFAADTAAVSGGHLTNYPSNSETVALQIPTGGTIPQHNVLYSGPCKQTELQRRNTGVLNDLD
ncbi:hypothetical protein BGY98DRAFT_914353 [Russula aff. rugulosa BPL654]|nr:hypothetical protein BGY98DRAFT_914353 [Russula aff. rugulosa BPL654]